MKKEKEKELLKLKREFSPKYILTAKLLEIYLFFTLFIVICFLINKVLYGIFIIIILGIIIFAKLVLEKRSSNQTVMKFMKIELNLKEESFF